MGTVSRPGRNRVSTPSGQQFLDLDPGHCSEADDGGCADAELAMLLAQDPFADDPHMKNVTWVSPSRTISVDEWANLVQTPAFDCDVGSGPGSSAAQLLSVEEIRADSLVLVVRASVPDHPKAPRKNNPAGVEWAPSTGAEALAQLDLDDLSDNDLLDYIHAANRLAAFAQAKEMEALAEFAARRPPLNAETPRDRHSEVSLWAAGELMAVYAISEGTAQLRLDDAATLAALPSTGALFREGLLDETRIRAIRRGLENVPETLFPILEPLFLPGASRMNPAGLTRKIRRLAEKHNPESLTERFARPRLQRKVWFTPLPDGMARLGAILPATPALALFQTLETWAMQAQHDGAPSTAPTPTGRPSRSFDNYLADCFLDLIHQAFLHPASTCINCSCDNCPDGGCSNGGESSSNPAHAGSTSNSTVDARGEPNGTVQERWFQQRIPAKVNITIPFLTLLNGSEEPGMLDGYGPIPPEQARELAAGATSWHRILTDPEKGTILSIGRQAYKPPADMVRLVKLKDPVCTGIGCDAPSRSCEIDHTVPFHQSRYGPNGTLLPGGETSVKNLRPRSKYCHRLKDDPGTGWTVEPHSEGITKTTTPTGREYLHSQNEADLPAPF